MIIKSHLSLKNIICFRKQTIYTEIEEAIKASNENWRSLTEAHKMSCNEDTIEFRSMQINNATALPAFISCS